MSEAAVRTGDRFDHNSTASTRSVPTVLGHGLAFLASLEGLRVVLVLCQAAMIAQTWRLFSVRTLPPNLPLWSWLPQLDMGPVLLASLVLVLVRPRVGVVVHAALLAAALGLDQMRLQPEWVSIAILLVATTSFRQARTLGWGHLASLWLWAGCNKAMSAGFVPGVAPSVAHDLGIASHPEVVAWGMPALEITLGLLAAVPRTRRWAGLIGFVMHTGAIVGLHMRWDWAILPWNVGLAWASLVLLFVDPARRAAYSGTPADARQLRQRRLLLAVLFGYPALAWFGALDLYLAHHVFTGDAATASVCDRRGRCSTFGPLVSGAAVKAPIPPDRRLFELWFRRDCRPGETLHVTARQFRWPLDHTADTSPSQATCFRA